MDKYVRKLQLVELEILEEVDRICKKNNIDYFLNGGTLLGAVRHKGFIPWDDDIDVTMTRKNYNKFIEACLKDLNSKYIIDNYKTNKKCCFSFTKIKKKGTLYVESRDYNTYDENSGIWVDVFPLDGQPKPMSIIMRIQNRLCMFLRTAITIKNNSNHYNKSKIRKKIYRILLTPIPVKFMSYLLEKIISIYDEDKVQYLSSFSTVYSLSKETFEKSKLFPYKDIEFEGRKFMGIAGYDYYLEKMYGDYMKLPPKDKRVNHHPYLIKFEDGEEIQFQLEDKYKIK